MSWAHYIAKDEIKDVVVKQHIDASDDDLDAYFTETDDYLVDLAERLGILEADIHVDTGGQVTAYILRRLLACFFCKRVCEDKAGVNNVESAPEMDKYYVKASAYSKQVSDLTEDITPEILTGDVDEMGDRASHQCDTIYRS